MSGPAEAGERLYTALAAFGHAGSLPVFIEQLVLQKLVVMDAGDLLSASFFDAVETLARIVLADLEEGNAA